MRELYPAGVPQAWQVLGEALQNPAQLQAVQHFNRHLRRIRIETWYATKNGLPKGWRPCHSTSDNWVG